MICVLRTALLCFLSTGAIANAGSATSFDDQFELLRASAEADRRAMLTANAALTPDEAASFWPIYSEYRTAAEKLADRLVVAVKDFAAAYPNVTNTQANALLKESLTIEADRVKLKQRYAKRFAKVLPAVKVARVLQIESKLDTLAAFELSRQIPLVPVQ